MKKQQAVEATINAKISNIEPMHTKLVFVTVLCVVLAVSACGGGGGSSPISDLQLQNQPNLPALNPGSTPVFTEVFSGGDGVSWPGNWATIGESADIVADIQQKRGRIQGNAYDGISSVSGLTRIVNNTVDLQDVDVTFTIVFEDFANQGIGFYVRQNGGYLTETSPAGQGYAVFWEGDFQDNLGLWYETNGVENLIQNVVDPLGMDSVQNSTPYRVRYQVEQINATSTIQRTRVWLASKIEPNAWNIETTTTIPKLQNISGGIAVDLFNYNGTASIYIDDIEVSELN